jgi:hypothetical protein
METVILSPVTLNLVQRIKKIHRNLRTTTKPRLLGSVYELVLPAYEQWYPVKYVNHQFDMVEYGYEAEYYFELLPDEFNISVWLNKKNKRYTIRIASRFKNEATKILRRRGFWYDTETNGWKQRRRLRSLDPNAVRLTTEETTWQSSADKAEI